MTTPMSFDKLKVSITKMGIKEGLDLILHIRQIRSDPPAPKKKKPTTKPSSKPRVVKSKPPVIMDDLFSDNSISSLSQDKLDKLLELFGD